MARSIYYEQPTPWYVTAACWDRAVLHAHGHCHGSLRRVIAHRFDVGADVHQWPVSFDYLFGAAEGQMFNPVDHHAGDL